MCVPAPIRVYTCVPVCVCLLINSPSTVSVDELPRLNVSYKPQEISPKFQGTVRQMLHEKIRNAYVYPQFVTDVIKPLQVSQTGH